MDSWERFNETTLPNKKTFYSKLYLKNIADGDYIHAQKVFKEFEIENLGQYDDLYVQSDTLLLAYVFENFRTKCIEIYELDPAHFLPATGLAWQACLKKSGVKLELLTYNNMLMMIEKRIRGGICQAIHRYAKANNKYMKNYEKKLNHHMNLGANNFHGWTMSQNLMSVNDFTYEKNLSKFDKDFIKNYDEDSDKGYIFEVDAEYPKTLCSLHSDHTLLAERMKIKNATSLLVIYMTKKTMLFI